MVFAGNARADESAEPASDFSKHVAGFVQKHCVHCHGEKEPKADLALHSFRDEAAVLKSRQQWQAVVDMVELGEMPPKERPRPAGEEVAAFLKTVEAMFERADRDAKPDPGHVTVRRLNRTEYNNTIRDLVGVDFLPAEDFPSDDIGHGFDNIGDVLSLSPVLMERYLAAAETIVQRAIVVEPPKPPVRRQAARYLEPAGGDVPQSRFRPIAAPKQEKIRDIGPLHTPHNVDKDAEYRFRVRVYAQHPDKKPVRIALLAIGPEPQTQEQKDAVESLAGTAMRPCVVLATAEVKADSEQTAEVIEVPIARMAGVQRIAVALVKTPEGEPAPTLFVEYLELEGPFDTRPATQRRLLACDASQPHREQTREILARFTSHAYRRPVTADEIERLVKLVEAAEARGEKWEGGIQLALQAVLVSPKFLFRLELDDRPDSHDPRPIDEFQLASRLSYFLWSTLPDDELIGLAEEHRLTINLDEQVRRMLTDPKSQALVENFALQWLQLRRLKSFAPAPKLFPSFNEPLRTAMSRETELFFAAIMREDRSVLELLDADFTFLNEPLARHYGITDTQGNAAGQKPERPGGQPIRGPQFVRVSLGDKQRGGLLTQASVLTVTSNPTRTSPVKRGRWVLEQLLGTPPPPPPPNVPELPQDEKAVLSGSLRQRLEQHRANPSCANCHARMDPLGFALENYDAIGAFRAKDGEFPVDSSGTLPDGQTFAGPAELKAILKGKKELFARCLAEKLLTYALGRGIEYYDRPTTHRITAALAKNDYKFSTLVIEIAKSDPFRMRRGKSSNENGP